MACIEASSVTVSHRGVGSDRVGDPYCIVVWLGGEHDISTMAAVTLELARAIALDDAGLVVELSEAQFIGAATVAVIIRAREFLRLRSRSLVLRSPTPWMRGMLEMCGLADLLDPLPTDATLLTGAAEALGSWVAVPGTVPADRGGTASEPARPDRARAAGVTRRVPSVAADLLAARHATNVGHRRVL